MDRKKNKQPKLNIKKDDQVLVITGADRGKKGRVIEVLTTDRRILVEGVNIVKKHLKPNVDRDFPQGGIKEKEMSINISNVKLVDNQGNGTRVGRKLNAEGKLQRYSKKSGEFIK
ncbi:MAG: 50S ribosomal protein L24 [Flavobacteriaceae bacterium]|nr:50S ribosomal protein L24 [Flavobacteriaceae bacterium]